MRGLLADGRKAMVPKAARLGIGHQQQQQFHYVADLGLRGSAADRARWSASSRPVVAADADYGDNALFPNS
jgi:hypothetical protein